MLIMVHSHNMKIEEIFKRRVLFDNQTVVQVINCFVNS